MQEQPWMPQQVGRIAFAPAKVLWLWTMLGVGCAWGLPGLTPANVLGSLALAFVTLCLGHSVGLHRGAIHASYAAPLWLQRSLVTAFVFSGLGGPQSWARLHAHRDHWQNRSDCPRYFRYQHGLARDFWLNLHLTFVPRDARPAESRLPPMIVQDRWMGFLERTWPLYTLAVTGVAWLVGGLQTAAVCGPLRVAVSILGHWFVGYAAHTWGHQPERVPGASESGTNVWLLGVLSFGEGFHNNHHCHPHSPQMGLRPHEWDLGFLCLRLMHRLGWVRLAVREA